MRVLLDECIPRKLKNHLSAHECNTVPEAGFAGKKNGELLKLAAEAGFEVFVTLDRGIQYQQNLAVQNLAVLVLRSKSSRLDDLIAQVPRILKVLGDTPKDGLILIPDLH
jgi:predicted nuclease of predicted toxin-antitoxin system